VNRPLSLAAAGNLRHHGAFREHSVLP
jgi:hypothetical protein